MKIFRRILFIILCIVLVLLSIGFLLPHKVHVERSLKIDAFPGTVFDQVNTLKNWEKWSPWPASDTFIQLTYSGPESGVGAAFSWFSKENNVGKGSLSIISSFPYDSLIVLMDFEEKGRSTSKFIFVKQNQSTIVTWRVGSNLGINPVSRWFGLFMDRMVGPDIESGLGKLRLVAASRNINGFEIIDFEAPSRILLSVRDTASPASLNSKLASMYNKISIFLKTRNLSPTGNPTTIYHNFATQIFDIEACIPVANKVITPVGMFCVETGVQKTVMVKYFGSNNSIYGAYEAIQTYINDKGLQVTGPSWEEYISDPTRETDSGQWQTNIYFPVK